MPSEERTVESYLIDLVQGQARLEEWAEGVCKHLAALNGSVARHTEQITALQRHPIECPLGQKVTAIELKMASEQGAAQESQVWQKRLAPVLWLALVFFIGLVLGHSEIAKAFLK